MTRTIYPVTVHSREGMEMARSALDELGLEPEYNEEYGLLSFSVNNMDVIEFQLHPDVLDDEEQQRRWSADAQQVAEYYWRQ